MSSIRQTFLSDPDVAVRLVLIVPKDYSSEVTELLLRMGVLEPAVIESGSPLVRELENYIAVVEKAKGIYSYLESNIEEKAIVRVEMPQGNIMSTVEALLRVTEEVYEKVKSINELISARRAKLGELEAMERLVKALLSKYPNGRVSLISYSGRIMVVRSVLVAEGVFEQLRSRSLTVIEAVEHEKKTVASVAASPEVFDEFIKTAGGEVKVLEVEEPPSKPLANLAANLEKKIAEERKSIEELANRKREILKSVVKDIAVLKSLVESEYERLKILQSAISSKYVAVITGWVLRSKLNGVLKSLSQFPAYVSVSEGENPPVDFKNLNPFKPFELLTELYGLPSPYEWDPTPLLTYSFLLFFSLMMSDAGYGLGVILATKYILPRFANDPESLGFVRLKKILYIGGALSIISGIASKSFLGSLVGRFIPLEKPLINALNIAELIGLSLALGFAFTFMSHLIALAKNIRLRRSYDSVYETGILILMVSGLFVLTRVFGLSWIYVPDDLFRLALSLTIAGIVMVALAKVRATGGIGGFLWLFDIVGIVSDVFSYVRIAGIAGGTAFLAEAFNSILVGIFSNIVGFNYVVGVVTGVVLSLVIHTLNLALSAISPFVHSLRLCLFEISSKFFEAQGRRIKPVKIVIGKISL